MYLLSFGGQYGWELTKGQIYAAIQAQFGIDCSALGTPGVPDPLDCLRDKIIAQIRNGSFDLAKLAAKMRRGQANRGATDGLNAADEAQAGVSMVGRARNLADGLQTLSVVDYLQGTDGDGI
jgi:hypothetical protein